MGFQPGIAIFVETEGQAVYEQFTNLVRHIHTALRHGIGLLCLSAEQTVSTCLLASDNQNQQAQTPARDATLTALTTLQARLRSDAELRCYRSYLAQERRPLQIYIIGSPSQAICDLAAQIRRAHREQVEISALFCCVPRSSPQELFAESLEFATWARTNAIRFSYFYGDLTETLGAHEEHLTYAAALALFALLTTDISNHAQFQGENAGSSAPYGTLSVCLISSLHHAIRQAYAANVGALLLEDWQKDLHSATENPEILRAIAENIKTLTWLPPKLTANKKPGLKITPEDLAPGPQIAIVPRTPEEQSAYTRLATSMARHTRRLHRPGRLMRTLLRKRAQAVYAHRWSAWKDAFLLLWQHIQEAWMRQAVSQIEQMWQTHDLSGTMALATRLDAELQTIIQQLQTVQRAPLRPVADKEQEQRAGRARPERLRVSLVSLIMGLLLSFIVWQLGHELGLTSGFVLLLLVASCFGGVGVMNWSYLRRTFPLSPSHSRMPEDDRLSHRAWLERCLQVSYQQRLDLATHLQQRLRCLTSDFLAQLARDLVQQAESSLEQPILTPTGGRNFLCGNERHFATASEASQDFLDHPSRGGRFIFNNLQHTRKKDSPKSEKEYLSAACKTLVQTFFSHSGPGTSEQFLRDALCYEIRIQIDPWFRAEQAEHMARSAEPPAERALTNYISRNDFELESSRELLAKALDRAQHPTLWQGQGNDTAPTNFLCTTPGRIKKNRENFPGPVIEVQTALAQERGAPSELTSRWILLCALYRK